MELCYQHNGVGDGVIIIILIIIIIIIIIRSKEEMANKGDAWTACETKK